MTSTAPEGGYPLTSPTAAAPVASAQSSAFLVDKHSELSGPDATTPLMNGGKDPHYSPTKSAQTAPSGASVVTSTAITSGLRPDTHSFVISGTTFQIDLKYKLLKPIGHGAYGVVM